MNRHEMEQAKTRGFVAQNSGLGANVPETIPEIPRLTSGLTSRLESLSETVTRLEHRLCTVVHSRPPAQSQNPEPYSTGGTEMGQRIAEHTRMATAIEDRICDLLNGLAL